MPIARDFVLLQKDLAPHDRQDARNWLGDTPSTFLKVRAKKLASSKPQEAAMSATESSEKRKSCLARVIRRPSRYSEMLKMCIRDRLKANIAAYEKIGG